MRVITVEAEYDGRAFIPREPIDLPAGKRVRLVVSETTIETRLELLESALRYFEDHPVARSLGDDELRREAIYEDC